MASLVLVGWVGSPARAADEPTADFVLRAFKDSRDRVRSGEFEFTGVVAEVRAGRPAIDDPFSATGWFDDDQGALRYDFVQQRRLPDPKSGQLAPQQEIGKYVRLRDKSLHWSPGDTAVVVRPAPDRPSHVRPFDPRSVGINNYIDYFQFRTYGEMVDILFEQVKGVAVTVTRPAPTIVRLEWAKAGTLSRIDFDVDKGYLPVRHEMGGVPKPGGTLNPTEWGLVEWVRVDGSWVPASAATYSGAMGSAEDRHEVAFKWKSVNRPIPPAVFMTRGLGVSDGTLIADVRAGGRAIQLGAVGDMTPSPRLAVMEPPPSNPWWAGGRGVVIVAAAVGVTAVGVFAARRGRWPSARRGEQP